MPKSEIIDLTLCFISIVGLLVNCYLFYRNSKKFMETEDYSLLIYASCNMGIVYGMLAFVLYMFSFRVSSKENIDFLHRQCLIDYISEGLFFLIAGVIKIVSKWLMKYKSTKLKCSNITECRLKQIMFTLEGINRISLQLHLCNRTFQRNFQNMKCWQMKNRFNL